MTFLLFESIPMWRHLAFLLLAATSAQAQESLPKPKEIEKIPPPRTAPAEPKSWFSRIVDAIWSKTRKPETDKKPAQRDPFDVTDKMHKLANRSQPQRVAVPAVRLKGLAGDGTDVVALLEIDTGKLVFVRKGDQFTVQSGGRTNSLRIVDITHESATIEIVGTNEQFVIR
ncbi:MAG: hypothetical protein KatS3mg105_1619 [Gemmatales bacterium]|nr:MAG: hypothetical protein KatS3mg105_1619 [Gemmatales bacterium]